MKHLTIIVPDGQSNLSTVASIVGAYEIFTSANAYRRKAGKKELFTIQLAGNSKKVQYCEGLVSVQPEVNCMKLVILM